MRSEHTYLTPKLRNGAFLLFMMTISLHIYNYKKIKVTNAKAEILITKNELVQHEEDSMTKVDRSSPPIISFDPNTADSVTLAQLGLSSYAIKNLTKLRRTGWKARKPEDLLKVYGLGEKEFTRIREKVRIETPEWPESKFQSKKNKISTSYYHFDPNQVTYKQLNELGFNSYATRSIVNFRNKGGEFKVGKDLLKIYGIDTLHYHSISQYISISSTSHDLTPETLSKDSLVFTSFDPNSASFDELVALGFSDYSANNLQKYLSSGASIRTKKDLQKIYGIEPSFYSQIEDYIDIDTINLVQRKVIESEPVDFTIREDDSTIAVLEVYNLNEVSMTELRSIGGIGDYYSTAILEYGNKLGGYFTVTQLLEVPSMKKEHFERIKTRFLVEGKVNRLIAPQLEFNELLRHPYVNFQVAKKLKNISIYDYERDLEALIQEGKFEDQLLPYIRKQ